MHIYWVRKKNEELLKVNYELETENNLTKLREYFYRTIEIIERGRTQQNWDEKQN
jgi:hypothetical protein